MAIEMDSILHARDDNGQEYILYPATKGENLFGTIDAGDMIKLLLKRAAKADLSPDEGEVAYATDEKKLYIGTADGTVSVSGNCWYTGTAMSGTSATTGAYSYSACPEVKVGDLYLNKSYGYVYQCTTAGSGTNAKWTYQGSIKGATGATGSKGATGAAGDDGVGISSIVQTTTSSSDGGTNVITVTLTDGSTSTFTVKNGSKGSTGSSGSVTVDSALSSTSTNPVQNKVIDAEFSNYMAITSRDFLNDKEVKDAFDDVNAELDNWKNFNKYCYIFDSYTGGATITISDTLSTYDVVSMLITPYSANSSRIGESTNYWGSIYGTEIYYKTSCTRCSDYAICREWQDGNPNSEDRVGKFVVQEGGYIRFATSADDDTRRMGVVSGSPCIIENSAPTEWKNKYLTDIYGRVQTQTVHHEAETKIVDGEEVVVREAYDAQEPVINPEWDETQEYIPRMDRPEFDAVGVLGILVVDDDGTCEVGGYCMPNDSSIATAAESGFYVEERLDDTHIKILVR